MPGTYESEELMPCSPEQKCDQHMGNGSQKINTPPKPAYGIRITQFPKEVWPQVGVRQPTANKHDTEHEMDN